MLLWNICLRPGNRCIWTEMGQSGITSSFFGMDICHRVKDNYEVGTERLNPENGICLSPIYDRAYDQGYISINENYEILLSSEIQKKNKEEYHLKYFAPLSGMKIILPAKYNPRKEFLQYHLEEVFKG